MKKLFEILIPVAPNEENQGVCDDRLTFVNKNGGLYNPIFNDNHNLDFETFAIGKVGGMSKFPAIRGVWIDNGQIYAEKMIPYRFACDENLIREIAEFAKTHYEQKSIFVAEIGTAEFL